MVKTTLTVTTVRHVVILLLKCLGDDHDDGHDGGDDNNDDAIISGIINIIWNEGAVTVVTVRLFFRCGQILLVLENTSSKRYLFFSSSFLPPCYLPFVLPSVRWSLYKSRLIPILNLSTSSATPTSCKKGPGLRFSLSLTSAVVLPLPFFFLLDFFDGFERLKGTVHP